MKHSILLAAYLTALLSGVTSAHPGHGATAAHNSARDMILPRAGQNSTIDKNQNSTDQAAVDHIPIFKAPTCICPPAICDTRMNAKSQCQCKSQNDLACYIKSKGGCPKPADNTCG